MANITVVWKNHNIKKVELTKEQYSELFSGVFTHTLDERLAELQSLEDGYYCIEDVEQYFVIDTKEVKQLNSKWREITFPLWNENVIKSYLDKLSEIKHQENERKRQEFDEKIQAEIAEFNNDMDTPLEFIDGVAKMKNYKLMTVELKNFDEEYGDCDLYLDGKNEINIFFNQDEKKYTAYDGVDSFGWYDTIKQAVKEYMDYRYGYKNPFADDAEYYEPSCSACGDGGCIHCEPHRFI